MKTREGNDKGYQEYGKVGQEDKYQGWAATLLILQSPEERGHQSRNNLVQEGCLKTKIYHCLAARVVARRSVLSMSRENIWIPRLWVNDLNNMVTLGTKASFPTWYTVSKL